MALRGRRYNSLENTISRMSDNVSALTELIGDTASEEARASIRALRQRLDYLAEESHWPGTEKLQESRETISENPLLAVGAAFGLGFTLVSLCHR